MLRDAAVVFTVVLGATGAALTLWPAPAPAPQAQAATRAAVPPAHVPAPASPVAAPLASVSKAADGHFWAEAQVDGEGAAPARVKFLVDTGATIVALTEADARRLGLDPGGLEYETEVQTAAGETRAARILLRSVSVAGARIENVEAVVVKAGLNDSLLGMSYLGRLSRFEATQSSLILRP
jgi:aspartyl protease family protein